MPSKIAGLPNTVSTTELLARSGTSTAAALAAVSAVTDRPFELFSATLHHRVRQTFHGSCAFPLPLTNWMESNSYFRVSDGEPDDDSGNICLFLTLIENTN